MVFIGYPSRKRSVPIRVLVPNLLTTLALCAGLASIHFSLKAASFTTDPHTVSDKMDRLWEKAMACIFLAAVFDLLDGFAARVLKVQSPFGAVLDSLSDFLSFGIAPALLLHQWSLSECSIQIRSQVYKLDPLGLIAVMTFVLCSALRLARFTAAARAVKLPPGVTPPPEPRPHHWRPGFFVGMPTPAAAGAVLIPPMLAVSTFPHYPTPDWLVILFTFMVALLMIGRQPMFSVQEDPHPAPARRAADGAHRNRVRGRGEVPALHREPAVRRVSPDHAAEHRDAPSDDGAAANGSGRVAR
jgi:CDP-diacylglycerol--serine O-phosphatidyltransferase